MRPTGRARTTVDPPEDPSATATQAPTTTPAPDLAGLVHRSSTVALLRLYGAILDELLRRRVVRSRNAPAGDLAEHLTTIVYRGELALPSAKSWDVRAGDGRLVQVKCRVIRPKQSGNYSFLRSWDFDVCVFVQLDSSTYDVVSAVEVPRAGVQSLARASTHVNGSRVQLTADLLQVTGAVDRTRDFRQAFEALDQAVVPDEHYQPVPESPESTAQRNEPGLRHNR